MKMFEFKRGDSANLEGKVVLYSNLAICRYPDYKLVVATYGSTDLDDLFSKASQFELENAAILKEPLNEIVGKVLKGIDASRVVPFWWIGFSLPSEELITSSEGHDVVYVGNYSVPETCQHAMHAASNLYSFTFADQMSSRHKKFGDDTTIPEKPHGLEVRLTPNKTHSDFSGEHIGDYVLQTYVVQLLDSARNGQPNIFDKLREEFTEFSVGSYFMLDVQRLSILAKETQGNVNPKLVEAYVQKIDAIHMQDYAGAAVMRDRIKQLAGRS